MIGIPNFDAKAYLAPKALPKNFTFAAIGSVVVGLVLLGVGYGQSALATKAAVLVALNYFTAVAFGGVIFAMAMTVTMARWGRPLKRFAEAMMMFTPVIVILFVLFISLAGGIDLYEWHTHPDIVTGHKAVWLREGPFLARNVFMLGLTSTLGLVYIRASLKPDVMLAAQNGVEIAGWVKTLAGSAEGEHSEVVKHSQLVQNKLAPVISILYTFSLTLYAFDAIMSLAPHWYANMFGGWYFASGLWSGMVWAGLFSLVLRKHLGIEKLIKPGVYHDLGKLIFGFSMIWAYMFYAQLLPIWYGNMTEEIGFLLVRMQVEPWSNLAPVVAAMCFLIPFATLLSRGIKKMPLGFGIILGVIAVGLYLERFLVAVPSVWLEDTFPPILPFIGAGLLVFGLLVLVVTKYLSSVPAVPVSDPYMLPHPDDIHVHSRDAHH